MIEASLTRDKVYFAGGSKWDLKYDVLVLLCAIMLMQSSGYSDGTYGVPENDAGLSGTIVEFSLREPYNTDVTNLSALFTKIPDPAYHTVAFESGTMFTNDDDLVLYGGLHRPTESATTPGPHGLLGYRTFQESTVKNDWEPGFFNITLDGSLTRFVTNGAGASVPSEDLGFYFGGRRGENWGPIMLDDESANFTANTLISVNMTQQAEYHQWVNETLPDHIVSRADAELIWVPTGERGILVVIGGGVYPEVLYPSGLSKAQQKQNADEDPSFMQAIPIYDIASQSWYVQNTTGDIPSLGRTMFCSTLASASDGSSHNIYIYGGYDGQDGENVPYDDVYILSLPSFIWTKVYNGSSTHGRSGHRCFRVFPDQMLVMGGRFRDPSLCVEGGIVQIFNLNTMRFQPKYAPDAWSDYRLPDAINSKIGGNGLGGANIRAPQRWTDSKVEALFRVPYQKSIKTWFPYNTPSTKSDSPKAGGDTSHTESRSWVLPAALGASIPVLVLVVMVSFLFYRRSHRASQVTWISWGRRVLRKIRGKDVTPEMDGTKVGKNPIRVRVVNSGVVELDTKRPSEIEGPDRRSSASITTTPTEMYSGDTLVSPITPKS
ncbi:uncharacterized protein N7446_012001 [Penicillium canescens]|uniref:uncharacterized protein n=1 Tax=Penicillium canescens TaxID=5083 RepID=UPI0026E0029E|nr:uncharacterized protein N7446_012001 [Penicillium canescens]KAJ6047167.1 hypothetical protein N7446_012001 [Penicillium canescens]